MSTDMSVHASDAT